MSRQQDLAAEALERGATPGRGYAIAKVISHVFHPFILGILSLLIVGVLGVEPPSTGALWALFSASLQIVPPTIYFVIRLRQGAYSDDDVSDRTQRNELYLIGIVNLLLGLGLLTLLGAPDPIRAVVASGALISAIAAIINLSWKISVHASSMGTTATLAALYSQPLGLTLWLCALALGWARVRTRNHTPGQVVAGLALATVAVLVTFVSFGLL